MPLWTCVFMHMSFTVTAPANTCTSYVNCKRANNFMFNVHVPVHLICLHTMHMNWVTVNCFYVFPINIVVEIFLLSYVYINVLLWQSECMLHQNDWQSHTTIYLQRPTQLTACTRIIDSHSQNRSFSSNAHNYILAKARTTDCKH